MSIKSDLKKAGIEVISELDAKSVEKIAKNISMKINETFPNLFVSSDDIFYRLMKLKMYKAEMIDGMAEANYFYKNTSIYFNEHISDEDIEEFAIHECIHYLQEKKDINNKLTHMGLCDYTKLKVHGLGLNEAGVQYLSSMIIGIQPDFEKYYNISLYTPSPSYYPLECSLLNEILFFTGTEVLTKSVFFSSNDFKNDIIEKTSIDIFNKLQYNFDKILKYEEHIIKLNFKISLLDNVSSKLSKLFNKVTKYKEKIAKCYINTQNLIIENFFNNEFAKIDTLENLDIFRRKLSDFSNIVGTVDGYEFFENYYSEIMNKLEHKSNILENGGIETALLRNSNSWIFKIFNKFSKFLSNSSN